MRIGKQIESIEIDKAQASPTESNVRELARAGAALHGHENGNDETSANNLGTLLRQVSESSTREIESLINELHGLRKKLNADGDRIQSDIEIHAELSEAVVRLTTIISENVKSISDTAKRRGPVRDGSR